MKKLLTIEFDIENESIELHFNKLGAEYLKRVIESLLLQNERNHMHLMTPEWGGNELSAEKQNRSSSNKLINHLKIMYWAE